MQQKHAPRPLPLFLELVRLASQNDPALAAAALEGLARYEQAPRSNRGAERPAVAKVGAAMLRDCGGTGAPVVLVPSLINPPQILDLDAEVSLAAAVAAMGRKALLLDWGAAAERADLNVAGHVEALLLPLLKELGEPPALVGYCLGGTMAIAAANLMPMERVVTLAAPWRFCAYPDDSRDSLRRLWDGARASAEQLGALPMEVLQGAFWSLDPKRTVTKFAHFAELPPDSDEARRFVTLEDWANEGEPLPYPAAKELLQEMFAADRPGRGQWSVGGHIASDRLGCPVLNITAAKDRITPNTSAPAGETMQIAAGHVGMVAGSARQTLHQVLGSFLTR